MITTGQKHWRKKGEKDMRAKGKSVKTSLMSLCMGNVLVACLIIGIVAIISIRTTTTMAVSDYEDAMNNGYNQEIKLQVQSVITILQAEYDKCEAGDLTEEEAKKEAADSIENIADGIQTTSNEVDSLADNAKTMQDYSDKSMDALQKLIEVNTKTKTDIDSMYAQTENTNDSVTKISQAATLITEISSQTNLLSLNASIEAARAGEAGKGFAVVAEEIGNLATQSANTATEINDIIKELTGNSEKSMQLMQTMNEASALQVNTLESTREMFHGLKDALQACVDAVTTITDRISVINAQRDKVTEDIETLNRLATDNAASTEETSAMSAELDGVVKHSSDIVQTLLNDVQILVDNTKQFKL